jgi:hypothetical protein
MKGDPCLDLITLIFWIIFILPIIVVIVIVAINGIRKSFKSNSHGEQNPEGIKELNPLLKYIMEAKATKMPNDKIKTRLLENGWLEGDIDIAFNKFAGLNQ